MVQYSADLKDLPKSSGIYIIKNAKTKKVYVGSSINITSRVRNHIKDLNKGIHHSMKLQRSFNKHGSQVFVYGVIELCDKNLLPSREKYWIDYYNSYKKGFNCSDNTTRPLTVMEKQFKTGEKHIENILKCLAELRDFSNIENNTLGYLSPRSVDFKKSSKNLLYKYSKILSTFVKIKNSIVDLNVEAPKQDEYFIAQYTLEGSGWQCVAFNDNFDKCDRTKTKTGYSLDHKVLTHLYEKALYFLKQTPQGMQIIERGY